MAGRGQEGGGYPSEQWPESLKAQQQREVGAEVYAQKTNGTADEYKAMGGWGILRDALVGICHWVA